MYIFLENVYYYYFFLQGRGFGQSSVRRNVNVLKAVAIYTKQSAVMQTQGYSGGSAEQMSWRSSRRRGVMVTTGGRATNTARLFQAPSIHSNRQFKGPADTHSTVGRNNSHLDNKW